jgi:hepatocyte growth factor-regulated tyrosine kinase substrate
MHAKLNTVVRYYDKMLEDRLATTYSQATYQEARPPIQSPQLYQYNPPPQSPISPPRQSQGYFPSRRSTFSDSLNSLPPAQVPHESPTSYSGSQPTPAFHQAPAYSYTTYPPPSMSPGATKSPPPQSYIEPAPSQYGQFNRQFNPPIEHQSTTQSAHLPQNYPAYHTRPSYPTYVDNTPYVENHDYYQQQPLQRREESSLIDL